MNRPALNLLAGVAIAGFVAVAPAQADVFSSQTFSGDAATSDALPGVNLNAAPGSPLNGNCVETDMPSFHTRSNSLSGGSRATECSFGNFSITTTNGASPNFGYDNTYGGNPPPWMQGWHGDRGDRRGRR
ncbi:hypothetical protein [Mesorhizobium sp. CAU 1732]|uniref:hypothetical protein n=1 Tax=Mesorhizobium sp. CAU 1732 TaxID=3140358 RepID=UPI0032614CEF